MLEAILTNTTDVSARHWAACYLMRTGRKNHALIDTFICSLCSNESRLQMSACACLAQIGPAASAAIPTLRRLRFANDGEVRRSATSALARVDIEDR